MLVGEGKDKVHFKLNEHKVITNLNFAFKKIFNRDYIKKKNISVVKKTSNSFCGVGCEMIYIGCEGNIFLCPGLRRDSYKLGNILKDDFKYIWENNKYVNYFRNKEYLINSECEMCDHLKFCDGGCKVRALNSNGLLNSKDPWMCSYYGRKI